MSFESPGPCFIHEIVTAVPEQCLRTAEAPEVLHGTCISPRGAKLLHRLAPLTGIDKRHLAIMDFQSTLEDEGGIYRPASEQPRGPGMGARSAAFDLSSDRLLRQLVRQFPDGALNRIDTLITASCTHASSPGLERPLFEHAPIPPGVHRWNLGFMGCSAALAAMRLVSRAGGGMGDALIVACELSSLHFQYTDALDQMTANLLFADGAGGVILSPRRSGVRVIDCRCAALPAFADQMVWRAGDHGLELQLAKELPDTIADHLSGAVGAFLGEHGIDADRARHWLVHPGGPQILDCVELSLRLPADALAISRRVLRDYGNMSSPTILFILKDFLKCGHEGLAVLLAFGPGLTIEMALLDIDGRYDQNTQSRATNT